MLEEWFDYTDTDIERGNAFDRKVVVGFAACILIACALITGLWLLMV